MKRDLFSCDPPVLTLSGLPEEFATVRLTGGYKHLGHRLLLGDSILAEVRSRTGQAAAVFRQYRRQVFQNGRVPLEKRKYLFGSLVLSILRFNLGTWPSLTDRCYAYFRKKVFAMYRGLVRATVPEPELRLWNNNKVLEYLAMPDPQTILYEARLRYSLSLSQHPEVLLHPLLAEEGWLALLRIALEWMSQQLRGYGPNFHPDWNNIFRTQPSAAKSWISKAVRHDTIQRSIYTQWTEWHHDFLLECQAAGLDIRFPWTQLGSVERPSCHGAAEACLACGKLFRNKAAWAVHAFRKHNRVNWRRHYISGSRCEACLKDYGTTERLLNHLTYSTPCANRLKHNLEQVPLRPGKNNKKRDRDPPLAIPATQTEGPVRPWKDEEPDSPDDSIDMELMERLLDVMERRTGFEGQDLDHIEVDFLVGVYKLAIQSSWADWSTIKLTVDRFCEVAIPDADNVDVRAMGLVRELLRLKWFFTEQEIEANGVTIPDEALRENAWEFCNSMATELASSRNTFQRFCSGSPLFR